MKKFELFPTTVMEFNFTNHPDLDKLPNILEKISPVSHDLVVNGSSSYLNLQAVKNFLEFPPLFSLKNDFQKCVDSYCNELKIVNGYIYQSWYNIMEKGGKVLPHNHGSSIVSGAFYLLLEENTCNLVFKSPLDIALNFISIEGSIHFQNDFVMHIKPYHLYLFPGWLKHYTEENIGDKRTVISFNTKFY